MSRQNVKDEQRVFDSLSRQHLISWLDDSTYRQIYQEGGIQLEEYQNLKVLDLGCGEGAHSFLFAKAGAKVTAIDISLEAIKEAKRRNKKSRLSVKFLVGDITNLPFTDSSFDVVLFFDSLHHFYFSGLKEAIAGATRVLRSGGKLIISEPNILNSYVWFSYKIAHFLKIHSSFPGNDYFKKMYTVNEQALDPFQIIELLLPTFTLYSLQFLSYINLLKEKSHYKRPLAAKVFQFFWENTSLLLPKKCRHDHFILILIKK